MESLWLQVLGLLRERTNEHNFNLWFKPIEPKSNADGTWVLEVPNLFFRDWLVDHYQDVLQKAFFEVTGTPVVLDVRVASSNGEAHEQISFLDAPAPAPKAKRAKKEAPELGLALNPRLSFQSFVVGPSNEFAHAAARAVANRPGAAYNPLFIYGGTGLGKTHLLQAVGHQIEKQHPKLRVAYVTSERFMNELINSIAKNQMAEFKLRYRDRCDVLLMDDIQFIAGKTSTQEEFFHTFNFLFESGKQVVVTSDQYPQEIKTLDERLRSRLQSGLVADIKAPDLETRAAILRKKSELDHFTLDDDVLAFLAKNIKSNVRELEGSLIRLEAYASLTGAQISLANAREVLRDFLHSLPEKLDIKRIQEKVCKYFKISLGEMLSKSRQRQLVVPRQIAIYLTKTYTDLSLTEIGSRFGGKDHSTVIASINRVEQLMAEDMNIRHSVEAIEKQLEAR